MPNENRYSVEEERIVQEGVDRRLMPAEISLNLREAGYSRDRHSVRKYLNNSRRGENLTHKRYSNNENRVIIECLGRHLSVSEIVPELTRAGYKRTQQSVAEHMRTLRLSGLLSRMESKGRGYVTEEVDDSKRCDLKFQAAVTAAIKSGRERDTYIVPIDLDAPFHPKFYPIDHGRSLISSTAFACSSLGEQG